MVHDKPFLHALCRDIKSFCLGTLCRCHRISVPSPFWSGGKKYSRISVPRNNFSSQFNPPRIEYAS